MIETIQMLQSHISLTLLRVQVASCTETMPFILDTSIYHQL